MGSNQQHARTRTGENPAATPALLPTPHELGLPVHFSRWRPLQDQAVLDAACAETRFVMQIMPVGGGKTATYVSVATLLKARALILTRTKALQAQIVRDFESMGLISVKGMNAYRCRALEPGGEMYRTFESAQTPGHVPGCDEGPCRAGVVCSLRQNGCDYYDEVYFATRSNLVVTNYAYWMFQAKYGKGLGTFDLLICDEAHEASEAVSDFLSVQLEPWEMARIQAAPLQGQAAPDQWAEWATFHSNRLEVRQQALQAEIQQASNEGRQAPGSAVRESRELQRLSTKYQALRQVNRQWVITEQDRVWRFQPVWPADYAEDSLFRGIPRIILTSATVRPKSAAYLGIKDAQLSVFEYPSTFPVASRTVLHIPTTRVHHRMSDDAIDKWLTRITQIIRPRLDRKGIIHTVSYARARQIQKASPFAKHMIVHSGDAGGAKLAVEKFKIASPPAILVSPSVTTGHDFPYEQCEYQIVTKLPFPDARDPLLMARQVFDEDYAMYLTMQTLVQTVGRSTRAADDFSEVFVIDDNIGWVLAKYKHLAPDWFLEAVSRRAVLPPPPLRLYGRTGRANLEVAHG